jgi:hypothetical protein
MYHRIVAAEVRTAFAQISAGNWEPMIGGMADRFSYCFYGESALRPRLRRAAANGHSGQALSLFMVGSMSILWQLGFWSIRFVEV